jgi:phosphoribosylaminoimidazolecarboxamide formyltransferase/IMP cyclohydrolase
VEKQAFTALFSVYNKDGIIDLANGLMEVDYGFLASAGTAKAFKDASVPVQDVATIVGDPILGHRVVTLSRELHAGLLAKPEDRPELDKLGIRWIDLVCVDLYPLEEEIAKAGSTYESVIEKTDIGGPAMLRAAAKGGRIVLADKRDWMPTLAWIKEGMPDKSAYLRKLAAKAEYVCAKYALASARYLGEGDYEGFIGRKVVDCKYGENAHQAPAALYSLESADPLAIDKFEFVAGDAPSFNNIRDLDRSLQTLTHITEAFPVGSNVVIAVKHGNPCGMGFEDVSWSVHEEKLHLSALKKAIDGDRRAIFGGSLMANFEIDEEAADVILTYNMLEGRNRMLDAVVARSFTAGAIELLERKKGKCRFIANENLPQHGTGNLDVGKRFVYVRNGFLVQPNYTHVLNQEPLTLRHDPDFLAQIQKNREESPDKFEEIDKIIEQVGDHHGSDLLDGMLAWAVGSTSNSNTITIVNKGMLLGNAVGQQDRVGACELALKRAFDAGHDLKGAVAYSDSFFPFPDGPEVLAAAGVRAILTTSGSLKDGDTRRACEEAGVRLYMWPDKEARGFFGH